MRSGILFSLFTQVLSGGSTLRTRVNSRCWQVLSHYLLLIMKWRKFGPLYYPFHQTGASALVFWLGGKIGVRRGPSKIGCPA